MATDLAPLHACSATPDLSHPCDLAAPPLANTALYGADAAAVLPAQRRPGRRRAFGVDPQVKARVDSPTLRNADLACVAASLFAVLLSNYDRDLHGTLIDFLSLRISLRNLGLAVLLLAICRFLFWVVGLYLPRINQRLRQSLWRVPLALVPCTLALLPFVMASHSDDEVITSMVEFWLAATTLMLSVRLAFFLFHEHVRPALRTPRTVIICGTGPRARQLAQELRYHPEFRYTLAGFVDSDPQPECAGVAPLLGSVEDMDNVLMRQVVDEVVLALPIKSRFEEIERILHSCAHVGIPTRYSLDLFSARPVKHRTVDAEQADVRLETVSTDSRRYAKAAFDFTVAAILVVLLLPVFLAIAIGIKLSSPGPVFFVQQRYGLNRRRFGMFKFRSMVVDAEARLAELEAKADPSNPMFKMKNDPRVTRFGALLRRTSLDELPQLFNVLRGEMSLVGPRPLPNRDVERFSEAWLMRRFSVKPGITGLWQVSGRSDTSFSRAIRLDLRYIDHWSLRLDLRILLQTFSAVVRSRGAY